MGLPLVSVLVVGAMALASMGHEPVEFVHRYQEHLENGLAWYRCLPVGVGPWGSECSVLFLSDTRSGLSGVGQSTNMLGAGAGNRCPWVSLIEKVRCLAPPMVLSQYCGDCRHSGYLEDLAIFAEGSWRELRSLALLSFCLSVRETGNRN